MQSFNCGITIRVPIINNYAWFKKNFSRLKSYDRLQSSVQCYQKTYTEQQGSALSLSLSPSMCIWRRACREKRRRDEVHSLVTLTIHLKKWISCYLNLWINCKSSCQKQLAGKHTAPKGPPNIQPILLLKCFTDYWDFNKMWNIQSQS